MAGARRSARAGALAATLAQLAGIAAGALTSFVVAREVGAHGTGVFAAAGQYLLAALMLGGLGLRTGIAHEISAGRLSPRAAATQATLMSALFGAIAGAVGFGLYELGSDTVFDGVEPAVAIALSAAVPFAVASWVLGAIPLASEDYEAFGALQSSASVIQALLAIPLVLAFGIDGALIGMAGSFVLGGILSAAWALSRTVGRSGGGWHLAESLRHGLRGWPLEMLQLLALRPDILIVAAYGSTADTGVYSLAVTITTIGWILPQALGTIALPRLAAAVAGDAEAAEHAQVSGEVARRVLRHGALLALVAGVLVAGLLLLAPVIFGDDFDRTVGLGMIMLPGVVALALGRVIIALLLGLGRSGSVLAIGAAVVPAALVAYLLAVPGGGPTAAAIVSLAAYLLTTAGAAIAYARGPHPAAPGELASR